MMRILATALLLSAFLVQTSCRQQAKQKENPPSELPSEYLKDAVIYEVNLRQFTPEGTISAFRKELKSLKELGVKILWFMPIQPIGELNRKGSLGSYYSIKDYTAVNPEFGTLEEFKSLVKECHELGFKVILDWVGNHSAYDHRWIKEHPEWYTHDSSGQIVPPVPDWSDVADLNYDAPGLRETMKEALRFWVQECDVDGYRCDVAFMVPADFWSDVRKSLDSIKPVFMLAEAEEHDMGLYQDAFDAYYGWELHHVMNEVAKGHKSVSYFDTVYQKKQKVFGDRVYSMNFITNHDENSWNGTEYERMGASWKPLAVLSYLWPGIPLLYTGQEKGLNKRLRFFDKDTVFMAKNAQDYFSFYQQLNLLKKHESVLHLIPSQKVNVQFKQLHEGVLFMHLNSQNSSLELIINFSDTLYSSGKMADKSILMQEGLTETAIAAKGFVVYK